MTPERRTHIVTLASIAAVVGVLAILAYSRRWISDDGLIYIRVVRNILEGNGPVFNAFERTEANTSALWPWLVALVGLVKSGDLAPVAVYLGLACSLAGFALGLDGTRRWHRARGSTAVLVPASSLVVVAVFPFWHYATSGLETGLAFLWLGLSWWLFVQLPRRIWLAVFVLGLGPLVRPDFAVVSGIFLGATWAIVRPPWRRTLALAGTALALPVAFQIFRMGFYGMIVPLPALAKSATHAEWERGWLYLLDFAKPYLLWLPLAILAGTFGFVAYKRAIVGRDRFIFAAPVVAALLIGLYIIRVGGDFMHARLLLPATFLLLLPGFVLPARRFTAIPLALLAGWALIIGLRLDDTKNVVTSPHVGDEHLGYVWYTQQKNPTTSEDHLRPARRGSPEIFIALDGKSSGFLTEGGARYAQNPKLGVRAIYAVGRLGMGGAAVALDGIAADTLGLANPIGARITMTRPDLGPGHQKPLPGEWLHADFGDPAFDHETGVPPIRIASARRAMTCGELKELLASVREPLTARRFFANLVGAVRRTRLVIPADAAEAEARFCGDSLTATISASSSCEQWGWMKSAAWDGIKHTHLGGVLGYSSQVWIEHDHPEWIEVKLNKSIPIKEVVLYPRNDKDNVGAGFPIDFTIQIWDGTQWIDKVTRTNEPQPQGPQRYALNATTDRFRIHATKLRHVKADGYVLQLAEIEITR